MDHHRGDDFEKNRAQEPEENEVGKELRAEPGDRDGESESSQQDELTGKGNSPAESEEPIPYVPDEQTDLEATRTTSTVPSVRDVASIPDGGLTAWLQVLGSFFLFFNSWGLVNTFGVYQTYYERGMLASSGASAIAWIGSIQSFLLLFVGALTGPLYDAGYFRSLMIAGSFLLVFGHMMLSLCDKYWQVFLAQGICIGLGPGFLFVPSVAILSQFFRRKLAFSVGIAAAGSSLGGTIYPIALHRLIPQVGWGWAVRTLGFIALGTLVVPNAVMRVRALPAQRRAMIDTDAFKHMPWAWFCISTFVGFMGLYTIFYYVEGFAINTGLTDDNLGFYLLSILNAASTFGRLVPNFMADKIGAFNVYIPAAVISGVITLCTIAVDSRGGVITIAALYGFSSGAYVSLPPTILVKITPNPAVIGTRMGMCFGLISFGMLIGAPVGGQVLSSAGYNGIWIYGGILLISGGAMTVFSRITHAGWKPFLAV